MLVEHFQGGMPQGFQWLICEIINGRVAMFNWKREIMSLSLQIAKTGLETNGEEKNLSIKFWIKWKLDNFAEEI